MQTALITIVALATLAISALFLGQRSLIFPAPAVIPPETLGEGVEDIPLEVGHAYLALPFEPSGPAPLLVFAHGNAEVAHWSIESFRYFRERGLAVLLLEYPGYSGAPGKPSAESTVRAGLLALDEVIGRSDIDRNRVVAYGRSIGSGVATQLALQRDLAAVILESPFTSLKAVAAEAGFPAFLLRENFDNAAAIAELEIPVFLYHGTRDRIIPVSHSDELAKLAKEATVVKADCGHNDCPRPWEPIYRFLQVNGLHRDRPPAP